MNLEIVLIAMILALLIPIYEAWKRMIFGRKC